jgi:Icc-related predicted phosphoesterase
MIAVARDSVAGTRTFFGGKAHEGGSSQMVEIIETHQPALWVYGHTHECDDQTIGQTRIISNQLGYPGNLGGFECKDFDEAGLPVEGGV